jgi:hypothetical protein
MTIKEIAELCGVTDQTILNWIHKLESLNQNIWLRISEKLEKGSPERPSDYDLGEITEIISEGGGNKMLAALLVDNAITKNALTVKPYIQNSGPALPEALIKRFERLLQDPKQLACEELARFVENNLVITGRSDRDSVNIDGLYEKYRNDVTHVLTEKEFSHAIVFQYPEIELKKRRFGGDFLGVLKKY